MGGIVPVPTWRPPCSILSTLGQWATAVLWLRGTLQVAVDVIVFPAKSVAVAFRV